MSDLYIPVGLPGCGKTTYTYKHLRSPVAISTDNIRLELADSLIDFQENKRHLTGLVFDIYHGRIYERLAGSVEVEVYADATNLLASGRKRLREIAEVTGAKTHLVVFLNVSEAFRRNKEREADLIVPDAAMDKLGQQFVGALHALGQDGEMNKYDSVEWVTK